MQLHNKYDRETLKKRLEAESFKRVTLSFYRYVILEDVKAKRDRLYLEWSELKVLGRIYLAHEGINAQVSVPEENFEEFRKKLFSHAEFKDVPFKIAVEDDGKSFLKLIIKVRSKIVADGLEDDAFDVTNVGTHLNALEFNQALEDGAIVVDMRNHYESEVGHFENAILPEADTFREELPIVLDLLKDHKEDKILLYCTGGIRCEKASAYLKHQGFKDVNQLHGGIISYAREIKEKGLESKFKGKNFVFDERMGERISEEVISKCHQCGKPADRQINCSNEACHVLFIQCEECGIKMENCCSIECIEIKKKSPEEQLLIKRKKGKNHKHHSKLGLLNVK
ncbi:MAG: rhodanese-related sulfurtransferase [Leptospiraceae bacterium]|nr:rhodanese-related sulfurtransferase [Leptospiraceae bacterium]